MQDVVPGLGIGGGGEGDDRHSGEQPAQPAELHILGPEVVAPLRDAVGLVNGEQGDLQLRQPLQETLAHQPLRRHIEQIETAAMKLRQHPTGLPGRQGRVVVGRGHAIGAQRIHLVLHQRDKRRDDNTYPGPMQRRYLVAERLAATGRHQHEGVLTAYQGIDDLLLVRAKGRIAEHTGKGFQRISIVTPRTLRHSGHFFL